MTDGHPKANTEHGLSQIDKVFTHRRQVALEVATVVDCSNLVNGLHHPPCSCERHAAVADLLDVTMFLQQSQR
eukprot:3641311-Amphidinium_carterae.1